MKKIPIIKWTHINKLLYVNVAYSYINKHKLIMTYIDINFVKKIHSDLANIGREMENVKL